jgi:ribosomal protein S2
MSKASKHSAETSRGKRFVPGQLMNAGAQITLAKMTIAPAESIPEHIPKKETIMPLATKASRLRAEAQAKKQEGVANKDSLYLNNMPSVRDSGRIGIIPPATRVMKEPI